LGVWQNLAKGALRLEYRLIVYVKFYRQPNTPYSLHSCEERRENRGERKESFQKHPMHPMHPLSYTLHPTPYTSYPEPAEGLHPPHGASRLELRLIVYPKISANTPYTLVPGFWVGFYVNLGLLAKIDSRNPVSNLSSNDYS